MTYKVISEEKLSQAVVPKTKMYRYKIFVLKHIFRFGIQKNCISKLSIKMFIKRKTRAGGACGCQILLSIRPRKLIKRILTSCRTNVSIVKQLSLYITRFFAIIVRYPVIQASIHENKVTLEIFEHAIFGLYQIAIVTYSLHQIAIVA